MDTSFDLVALLRQQPTTRSRKMRPTQFVSVAEGVQKRLHTNIKNRKSSRLSVFDRLRNIGKSDSPKAPALSDSQEKALHRKHKLAIWKEDKEKKKKESAAYKKKPFVAGMSHRRTFGPPPPPRPGPSTSGRVTRSQSRQQANTHTKSFAPRNATFNPSIFLDTEVPTLEPLNKKKVIITFEPVPPKNAQKETRPATRATRAKPVANKPVLESKTRNKTKVNAETTKTNQQYQSSTSSETEQPKLRKNKSLHKSVPPQESTSQDSACVLQDASTTSPDTVSMTSEEHNSQGTASTSFKKIFDSPHNAFASQDNATVIEVLGTVSMSSQDELSTPRTKVPKSESSSEEKLRSPKPIGELTPEQIIKNAMNSPCVTWSRGNKSAKKEMLKKLGEECMAPVNHFRRQLDLEIARMTATCETWDQVFAQTVLPEPVQELVLTALGQARLLMSKKLQQFAGLVETCANPIPGAPRVFAADLQGFWDMVYMQVDNVYLRFNHLEELRLRDWIEEQKPSHRREVVAKPAAKKPVVKPTGGPSRIREMIEAARKAKKNQESQSENSHPNKSQPTASPETKTFDAGFFTVSSPLRQSPAPGTPGYKSSLLKCVLSNEANKSVSKMSTSFPRLQASMLSSGDIEGVTPLMQTPAITLHYATPARSILKLNNSTSTKKTDRVKTVLFQDPDDPSSPASYTSLEVEAGSPEPTDDKENQDTPKKGTTSRRSRLKKQNAVDQSSPSPLRTSSQRKSAQTCIAHLKATGRSGRWPTRKAKIVQLLPETETPSSYSSLVEANAAGPGGSTGNPRSTRKAKVAQLVPETEAPSLVKANTAGPGGSTGKPRSTRKAKVAQLVPETEAPSLVEANAAGPGGSTGKPRSTRKAKVAQLVPETEAPSLVEANAAGPGGSTGKPRSTRKAKVAQLVPETEAPSLVEANAAGPEGSIGKQRSTRKAKVAQLLEPETEAPRRYSRRRRSPAAE